MGAKLSRETASFCVIIYPTFAVAAMCSTAAVLAGAAVIQTRLSSAMGTA